MWFVSSLSFSLFDDDNVDLKLESVVGTTEEEAEAEEEEEDIE